MPVYSVEDYIVECLDSIYSQGLPESEFEVICVDDCSPDNSKRIIQSYQSKYSNLALIEHETNKKSGGARNTGLSVAKGKYVWFVDPDDVIMPGAVGRILEKCEKQDLNVLCFNFYIVNPGSKQLDTCFCQDVETKDGLSFLKEVFGNKVIFNLGYPWRAVYSLKKILDNNIKYVENMPYGQETTFMAEVISLSERVAAITDALYGYRQNETNVSYSLHNQGKGNLIYYSIIGAAEMVLKWKLSVSEQSKTLESNIDSGLPWFVNRLFFRLIRTSNTQRAVFYKCLSEDARNGKQHDELFSYMDFKNRFIVKHPKIGQSVLAFLAGIYNTKQFSNK